MPTSEGVTTCPTLSTDRLTLRPRTRADFDAFAAFYQTDRSRHVGGPLPAARVWYGFMAEVGYWATDGFGGWAVERRADGALIGEVCIQHPPFFPEVELGWTLLDGFEGHGYATEAAEAARDWAFGTRGLSTLVSYIDPENARSIAVAERLGATRDSQARAMDPEDFVYRHRAGATSEVPYACHTHRIRGADRSGDAT